MVKFSLFHAKYCSIWHALTHSIFTKAHEKYYPHFNNEETDTDRLNDLPKSNDKSSQTKKAYVYNLDTHLQVLKLKLPGDLAIWLKYKIWFSGDFEILHF